MSRDVYSEINLHIVWHTKESRNLIPPEMETDLYPILRQWVQDEGAWCHEVGGIANHVHVVVSVPPTLKPSEFIGHLKGGSAHDVNLLPRWRKSLEWQSGYGLVSFGTRDLPWVCEYVRNQKLHHARGTVQGRLERICAEIIAEAKEREARKNGLRRFSHGPVPRLKPGPKHGQAR